MKILFVILLLIISTSSYIKQNYLYNPDTHASINPCGSDKSHLMCNIRKEPMSFCSRFLLFSIDSALVTRIMHGINGLRSKEAKVLEYEIANMNLLYWDDDLAEMAKQYIYRCDTTGMPDTTSFIGDPDHTIRQIYYYIPKVLRTPQWFQMPIRSWFLESRINKPFQFSANAKFTPYTQLIWPSAEYVGCAGARVAQGTLFVCYFAPRADENNITVGVRQGASCSDCSELNPVCSTKFRNLCGHDFAVIGNRPNSYMIFGMLVIGSNWL